jgi:hypothetical protein
VKLSNATADERVLSNDGRPIAGQGISLEPHGPTASMNTQLQLAGEGQVLLKFEGWLRDVSFKHAPRSLQYHPKLGLLVSADRRVLRFDPITGDYLHTLIELQPGGEVSCFVVE